MDQERQDELNPETQEELAAESGSGGSGAFFSRIVCLFTAPSNLFEDIRRGGVSWWQPFIWLSLLAMLVAYLSLPIQLAVTRLNERGVDAEQLERSLEMMEKFGLAGVFLAPIGVLIFGAIISLIGYIAVSILSAESTFKKYFTLVLYSSVISYLSQMLSVILIRFFKGVETIRSAEDAHMSFGLRFLAGEDTNAFLKAVYQSLDIFSIWSLVIIAMGLMHIFRMTRNQSIICVIPLWLIGVVMLVIGSLFGGM